MEIFTSIRFNSREVDTPGEVTKTPTEVLLSDD